MNNDVYFWKNYLDYPKEVQDAMLDECEKRLKDMTAEAQIKEFMGAPGIVILEFLPSLDWDVQVAVYKKHLPVRDRANAAKLLKDKAKEKLGLKPKWTRYSCLS